MERSVTARILRARTVLGTHLGRHSLHRGKIVFGRGEPMRSLRHSGCDDDFDENIRTDHPHWAQSVLEVDRIAVEGPSGHGRSWILPNDTWLPHVSTKER